MLPPEDCHLAIYIYQINHDINVTLNNQFIQLILLVQVKLGENMIKKYLILLTRLMKMKTSMKIKMQTMKIKIQKPKPKMKLKPKPKPTHQSVITTITRYCLNYFLISKMTIYLV